MSSLEAGADDFAFEEAPEHKPLTPATPRELKRLIKDWRSGRATRNVLQAMGDAYVAVFGAAMIGAMVVNVILKAQRTIAQCNSATCLSARAILPWAAFAATVGVALAASRLFGPVLASAAEGFWLLDAPISRAKLLRSRLGRRGTGGVAERRCGRRADFRPDGLGTGRGAGLGGRHRPFGGGVGRLRGGTAGHRATPAHPPRDLRVRPARAGCAVQRRRRGGRVVQPWHFGQCRHRARRDHDRGLASGAGDQCGTGRNPARSDSAYPAGRRRSLVSGISGAFFALDIGLARDIVVERRAMERGHVRPKRGKGVGLEAIIWREWQRLWRFPQPLLVFAATIVVPYAADALGMSTLTPVFAALALFGATIPLLGGLRVLTRTGGLARCLPFSLARLKLASIAVPGILAAVWAVATTPAYLGFGDGAVQRPVPEASLMAVATAAAGLLAAVRWTQAKGVDFGAPMVASQAGAFPPGLVTNLFRGFDVCILTTAPMLLGFSPWWSLGIAAIAAAILLNSMDAETLRARQAEQQKQLATQKKERADAAAAAKQRKR